MKPFGDYGKDARDLLNKDYFLDCVKLSHKGKVEGIELKTDASMDQKATKLASSIEAKFKYPQYGLSLTESWDHKNMIKNDLCMENYLAKGLKQNLLFNYNVESGDYDISMKNAFKNDKLHTNFDLKSLQSTRDVTKAISFGSQGYLFGGEFVLNPQEMKLKNANLAFGYQVKDLSLFSFVNNFGKDFSTSLHTNINDRVSMAGQVNWNKEKNAFAWCGGVSCILDDRRLHTLKAKLNEKKQMTIGVTARVSEEVKIHASTCLTNPTQVGFGVTIEA